MKTGFIQIVKPCVKCGASDRYANGKCKPCARVMATAWGFENRDRKNANVKEWKLKNPDATKAIAAKCYISNRDARVKASAEWRLKNPEKVVAISAAHYARNRSAVLAKNLNWAHTNPEKIKIHQDRYRLANAEKIKSKGRAYQAANLGLYKINNQNRRAKRKDAGGTLSKNLAEKLFKLQRGMCPCCKQPLGGNYHMDHIIPLAKGGANTDDNMQLLRAICNMQKNAKHPVDFMQSRGFLL